MSDTVRASELARATYCPRQLYYTRKHDEFEPPTEVQERRSLAFRYPELLTADDARLRSLPLAVEPAVFRENLNTASERPDWDALVSPAGRDVLLAGKDCRGIAHKLLEGAEAHRADDGGDSGGSDTAGDDCDCEDAEAPPVPVLVSGGVPPPEGVWEPQAIRAVALAKALAWERQRAVPRALVEYPAVGCVRTVRVTARRAGRYREVLRTVRTLDGPPARLDDDAKCGSCDYRAECGVKSRSLRSLLGL